VYVIKTRRDKAGEKCNGVGWNRELERWWGGFLLSQEMAQSRGNGRNVCFDH
jgi:hypothetical protein